MAISSIDYEKVDTSLLQILQQIKSIENFISSSEVSKVFGTSKFIIALDDYRNDIAIEIEKQGAR